VTAAEREERHRQRARAPDLFWALRGGGGNFGVAASLEYRLHPVGPLVFAGPVFYAAANAAEVLRGWRDLTATMPDELTTLANILVAPPVPFLPEAVHGQMVIGILGVYAGTAFAHRNAADVLNIIARSSDREGFEEHAGWARATHKSMGPWSTGGYVNFTSEPGQDKVRASYPPDTYARLVDVKDRYDPTNLFRLNQNIRPSGGH